MSGARAVIESGQFLLRALIDEGRLTESERRRALAHATDRGTDPAAALVELGIVTPRELALTRAAICEYPFVDLDHFEIEIHNARRLPRRLAERAVAFPLFICGGVATVAMADPLNLHDLDQIRQALQLEVDPVLCDEEILLALIRRAYSLVESTATAGGEGVESDADLTTGEEPVVAAVNQVIVAGIEMGASDIHLSPDEGELQLRYRVDGGLRTKPGPGLAAHASIIQRLKVMAKLDITQTRRPQDGKFRFHHAGQRVDVRLSLIPTVHGENAALRLLRPAATLGTIDELDMPPAMLDHFRDYIHRPNGIILVTGPTGSGKTTTLYTAMAALNRPEHNLMTIEDPVEIRLPGIRQVQVNTEIGLDFAAALRSVLRQDPDVVLVGEIRDAETARIAVQAAMTGHLVLSTLHTNDAVSSIARLRDFGVPSFAINSALLCAIAQRLVRRACRHCSAATDPDPATLRALGLEGASGGSFVHGPGCPRCLSTGYRGRIAVYEMFRLTPAAQRLIETEAPLGDVRRAAAHDGLRPMLHDGLQKAALGLTTLDELTKLRAVLQTDPEDPAQPTTPPPSHTPDTDRDPETDDRGPTPPAPPHDQYRLTA